MVLPAIRPTHLFDTTVFLDHFRNKSVEAGELLTRAARGSIVASISVITSAELWRGVCTRTDEYEHRLVISPFMRIPLDHELALRGGELVCYCKKDGYDVNLPDGLIAATAERHNLIIVTRNTKHFEYLKVFANFRIDAYKI